MTQIQDVGWKQALGERHIEHVLVPIDFSSSTAEILRYARVLAEEFGSVIQLLHVIPSTVKGAKGS